MKNLLLFLFIITLGLPLNAQNIPNNGFENWTNSSPDDWDISNETVLGITFTTVTQDTSSLNGNWSVKIRTITKTVFGTDISVPGLITLGDFTLDIINQTGDVDGGIAFTSRPDSIIGNYVSRPAQGDSGLIAIGFGKWNTATNSRDTIAESYMFFGDSVSNWHQFAMPIDWMTSDNPDSMNIIITSSDLVNYTMETNSSLWIDNLAFVYNNTGIFDFNPESNVNVFPDQRNRQIRINFQYEEVLPIDIQIISMGGQQIITDHLTAGKEQVSYNMNAFTPGMYIVNIILSGKKAESLKFIMY